MLGVKVFFFVCNEFIISFKRIIFILSSKSAIFLQMHSIIEAILNSD